jgi:uncharacterized protein YhfF
VAIPVRTTEFGFPGELRDRLNAAILSGEKTATSSLFVEYALDEQPLPRPGERLAVLDSQQRRVAVIEIVAVHVTPLSEVGLDIALAEGEGFRTVAEWRRAHEEFWNSYRDWLRERLGDASWQLTDDTAVVVEQFRLIERQARCPSCSSFG